ncbi:MAG: hypothetical protein WCZ19_03960 [Acholeplasma sp.]
MDLGLTDPTILGDWLKLYRTKGEAAVKDTYSSKGYLTKDKRAKAIVDQTLLEEND